MIVEENGPVPEDGFADKEQDGVGVGGGGGTVPEKALI